MAAPDTIIKFYNSWTCPFAQRAWIALNHLNVKYDLIQAFIMDEEKNEYTKSEDLLKVNPKGVVPTLDVNGEIVLESIGIIEYLHKFTGNINVDPNFVTEELMKDANLMHGNIIPSFFGLFKKEELAEQDEMWNKLMEGLKTFTEHIQPNGYFKSATMNVVDITIFTFAIRLCFIETFRQKSLDKCLPWVQKFLEWRERMLGKKAVLDTVADQDKLLDSWRNHLIKMGVKY